MDLKMSARYMAGDDDYTVCDLEDLAPIVLNDHFHDDHHDYTDTVKTQEFHRQLCQYEDHAVRMMYEYFRDDLLHIVENLNAQLLLSELHSQNIPDVQKYQSLKADRKTLARTLLRDIFDKGRKAVIGLWISLYVLQWRHNFSGLNAVLEELRQRDVQKGHKKHLHEKTEKFVENQPPKCNQGEESFPFCTRYVNLIIVSTNHFRERSENELIETGVKHERYLKKKQNKLERISPNKLFRWCHRSRLVPHMVMVSGVPGVGKTTLIQKFVYDWVRDDLYQRFSFVFFFKIRELNRLGNVSLETLILHQYPYLEEQLGDILQDPEKLLFIFDGLDESLHTMDFTSHHLCSHPKLPEPCGQIVVSLVRKSLLNGCSVLMTSRPTRLASIDCSVFERIVEITGFFPEERQMYFENFFSNPELAEKAFSYVKQNEILYTFCYLPSYCWIICTVLSRSFQPTSSDQPTSLIPKTVTQLFAIFIANILANHSLHKRDAQKLLRSIGWMAEHGVMNHLIIFDDRDLESFHVDNKLKLLSSFLMESDEPVSYSFLHLMVQEFFSALVHYADYSPEKLQESLKKAKSFSDGRSEMFFRFLCGLSDSSTRSLLAGYLDLQEAQVSREAITWLNTLIEEHGLGESADNKQHLPSTLFYLYETRNKALVKESLKSHRSFDFSKVHMSSLDCSVLAFILKTCTNIEELNLRHCMLDTVGFDRLAPALHQLTFLTLADNKLPHTSCIQLTSVIRNNKSLKTFTLSFNHLYGSHFDDMLKALYSPAGKLELLDVAENGLSDTSCSHFPTIARNNRSLKILYLACDSLYGPHFNELMEALSSPDCRIEELRLAYCSLPNTACTQLASLVRNNRSLKILDLYDNYLSGPQFCDLMEALSSSDCRIEELRMEDNRLSENNKEEVRRLGSLKPNMKIYYEDTRIWT
ncbi:NACHT, LRR and PYD domains-containing protein 12-like isoform X2 [Phyllobates terribilis]|uniref:NACHT, LRR and PYD domains-containing protein 12-like isoform X2 n=1 Tax=Phyllobates terribilis TaxID=111132 RepID=UPI003CCB3E99